jgi:IS30 family transposase
VEDAESAFWRAGDRGTDLSAHSAADLARIAASLNNRPRKTLGFMKPLEKLAKLLARTI